MTFGSLLGLIIFALLGLIYIPILASMTFYAATRAFLKALNESTKEKKG